MAYNFGQNRQYEKVFGPTWSGRINFLRVNPQFVALIMAAPFTTPRLSLPLTAPKLSLPFTCSKMSLAIYYPQIVSGNREMLTSLTDVSST